MKTGNKQNTEKIVGVFGKKLTFTPMTTFPLEVQRYSNIYGLIINFKERPSEELERIINNYESANVLRKYFDKSLNGPEYEAASAVLNMRISGTNEFPIDAEIVDEKIDYFDIKESLRKLKKKGGKGKKSLNEMLFGIFLIPTLPFFGIGYEVYEYYKNKEKK